ncbi:MAG: hypothetical protein EXS10_06720 [Phycisphaerales bacterium]|nr:hypothetical protein [Phycisphaerales bacterium]
MTVQSPRFPTICRATLLRAADGRVVIRPLSTEYEISFELPKSVACPVEAGHRIEGSIHARAQKMHLAQAGGEFIEPLVGSPRIVQGKIRQIDVAANALLIEAIIPMWMTLAEGQSASSMALGTLVNFYVEPGAIFQPKA